MEHKGRCEIAAVSESLWLWELQFWGTLATWGHNEGGEKKVNKKIPPKPFGFNYR